MIKTSISGINAVKDAIRKEAKKYIDSDYVLVGVTETAGKHNNSDLTVAQVAAINEFGTPRVPERSFLRTGVEEAQQDFVKKFEDVISKGGEVDEALEFVGLIAQQSVQKKIEEIKSPANAQSTIDKKGSSNPLIDTGQLRQSITYLITSEKPQEGL